APLAAPAALPPAAAAAPRSAPALRDLANPSDSASPSAPAGRVRATRPRALDALRAHGADAEALAARLKTMPAEDAAPALSANFMAAATLDPELGGYGGPTGPSGPPKLLPAPNHELLSRLLTRVTLEDGGNPARRAALTGALTRMLRSETARELVERFLARDAKAVIRFEEFPGSRIYETDGRRIFHAPRAFTEWRHEDGTILVRLNGDYLATDSDFQEQDLPPTIAHELLGHGLWYQRAAAEDAYQAFHHHELNETNARLVGWLTDFELDGRFEENGAWSYLQDPAGFLSYLKLRLPYYALTFSNAELADPVRTLESRLAGARAKRVQIEAERANNRSWLPVLDHFVRNHGLAESRTRALRAHLESTDQSYADELATIDSLIAEVDGSLTRMKAEPEHTSERYLKWAATHPMFADLERETAARTARLLDMVRRDPPPADPESARKAEDHWRGQVTFDELTRMVEDDKLRHPEHWRR
ncbi:MAG: hypothetical protein HY079_06960, partial [Elusimicrobia bacterium]|nr:hypothetical protein [Elusimicrobiota bacterium]